MARKTSQGIKSIDCEAIEAQRINDLKESLESSMVWAPRPSVRATRAPYRPIRPVISRAPPQQECLFYVDELLNFTAENQMVSGCQVFLENLPFQHYGYLESELLETSSPLCLEVCIILEGRSENVSKGTLYIYP